MAGALAARGGPRGGQGQHSPCSRRLALPSPPPHQAASAPRRPSELLRVEMRPLGRGAGPGNSAQAESWPGRGAGSALPGLTPPQAPGTCCFGSRVQQGPRVPLGGDPRLRPRAGPAPPTPPRPLGQRARSGTGTSHAATWTPRPIFGQRLHPPLRVASAGTAVLAGARPLGTKAHVLQPHLPTLPFTGSEAKHNKAALWCGAPLRPRPGRSAAGGRSPWRWRVRGLLCWRPPDSAREPPARFPVSANSAAGLCALLSP